MGFADAGDDDAAAFGANFKAAEISGGAAERVVGGVEAILNARVRGVVEAIRAEEQVEFAQGLDGIGKKRLENAGGVSTQRSRIIRRQARRGRLRAGLSVNESCGSLYQKLPHVSRGRKRSPGLKRDSKCLAGRELSPNQGEAANGILQVLKIKREVGAAYSTTRPLYVLSGYKLKPAGRAT
jgi:hypothetical protein